MGGPRRARTVDPRIKSPLLYRLSYRPHCALTIQYSKSQANRIGVFWLYLPREARSNRSLIATARPSPTGAITAISLIPWLSPERSAE